MVKFSVRPFCGLGIFMGVALLQQCTQTIWGTEMRAHFTYK